MAYDFLGLVNGINERTNDVQLTSATFASATGPYSIAKQAVNNAIRHINQDQFSWPFNYVEKEETLVPGTMRYPYPSDAKWIDFNTFRIKRNSTFGNETRLLKKLDYEQYLEQNMVDKEYDTSTAIRELPHNVIQAPGLEYVISPPADEAYTLVYEYYSLPVDLNLYSDVPSIPQSFKSIIIDGAMYWVYHFRSDTLAEDQFRLFEDEIKNMREIYMNRYEYVRSSQIIRPRASQNIGYS